MPIERVLEIGRGHRRRPRPVRHDRVQPPTHQRRQRGEQAPRRDRERDLARASRRTGSWRSRTASTRRPGSVARSATCSSGTSTPTSTTSTAARQPRAGGSGSSESRRRSCGRRTSTRSASSRVFARGRLRKPVRAARRGAADAPGARRGAGPEGPDDRLRAPVRDVQARRDDLHRHASGWRACWPTRTGPSSSSSPARPIPPTGRARP